MTTNKETVIVGVSGGPDSMYLLDLLNEKDKYEIIVAHVNYQMRENALRDELIVENYCLKNNLKFVKKKVVGSGYIGNFQAWARKIRYDFFKELYKLFDATKLFIAHHRDDDLATFIFQTSTDRDVDFYGLKDETIISGMNVVRPLLKMTKKQILNENLKKNTLFGVDETNFLDIYTRNKINFEIEEWLESDEQILEQKNSLNEKNSERNRIVNLEVEQLFKEALIAIVKNSQWPNRVLHDYVIKFLNQPIKLSYNKLQNMLAYLFASNNEVKKFKIKDNIYLIKTSSKTFFIDKK